MNELFPDDDRTAVEMKVSLLKTLLPKFGGNMTIMKVREEDELSPISVNIWHKTNTALVMHLTNGTVQIDFYVHARMILCPLLEAVTYIDETGRNRTFR